MANRALGHELLNMRNYNLRRISEGVSCDQDDVGAN